MNIKKVILVAGIAATLIGSLILYLSVYTYWGVAIRNRGTVGFVYKHNDYFYIELKSGTRLLYSQNQQKVWMFNEEREATPKGNYKFLPPWDRDLIDLSHNEGFARQIPVVENGMVDLSDPMIPKPNGQFQFSLKKTDL